MNTDNQKKYKQIAIIVSVILPVAVAILFGVKIEGYNFGFLPSIYATINGLTAVVLLSAYFAIKKKIATPEIISGTIIGEINIAIIIPL